MTSGLPNPLSSDRGLARLVPKTAAGMFIATFWLWWALLAFFNAFPQIDIMVARLFFSPSLCPAGHLSSICGSFPYSSDPILEALRMFFFRLPLIVGVIALFLLIRCYGQHGATFNMARARALKVALISLLLGPGLLVNVILKEISGRPRPRDTDIFGGSWDFVQAASFSGKCISNCSFVSGEAAGAGWLFCLIFLIPPKARASVALPLAAISLLTPALRIAFGAHYLSDVVLGWLSSIVIFTAVAALTNTTHRQKIYEI